MVDSSYLNFDLLLHDGRDSYVAMVVNSPSGEASADFWLPDDVLRLADDLQERSRSPQPLAASEDGQRQDYHDARELGRALYEAIFVDDVEMALVNSVQQAGKNGLRIRLRIAENAPQLNWVPWEYLYSERWNRFLTLSRTTPIVRYIDVPLPTQPLAIRPPLHILAVVSEPENVAALAVDREWQQLQESLADLQNSRQVMLERLPAATYAALQSRLSDGPVHVLHFIGHGYYVDNWRTGGLVLEDADGQPHQVDAAQLGALLHDHSDLRLAFLNACESALSDEDIFTGVAQQLVQQEVPAVIAMQFPISDAAAITLSTVFYAKLAEGLPVDMALVDARLAVSGEAGGFEWATPVLFSRSADNRLLRLPQGDARVEIEHMPWEPETVLVEAGEFIMGNELIDGIRDKETPVHTLFLSDYRIGRYPVTNEEYALFLAENSEVDSPPTDDWSGREPLPDKQNHPVSAVTWYDAVAYCRWLSEKSGSRRYRLPTEAEWEKAARGHDGRRYPWGEEWNAACAQIITGDKSPVNAHPDGASPYSVLDLAGNVQEWTLSLWGRDAALNSYPYPYRFDDGREQITEDAHLDRFYRISRGGSYKGKPEDLRATHRLFSEANTAVPWRGFRVVMEISDHATD